MFYCIFDLSCGECNVISVYFRCLSVNGPVCLVFCVSASVCALFGEQFAICLNVVVILLLNVIEVFSVGGGAMFG